MTDEELVTLNREQVDELVNKELLEKGIKIASKPIKPEFDCPECDKIVFSVPLLSVKFTKLEAAQEFNALMKKFNDKGLLCETEGKYIGDKYLKCYYKKDHYTWRSSGDFVVDSESVMDEDKYAKAIDDAGTYDSDYSEYSIKENEYSDYISKYNEVKDRWDKIINEAYKRINHKISLSNTFNASYLPLSDSVNEAMKFFEIAYKPTDDEKKYVLDNLPVDAIRSE